ncbi:hypothetical protein ACNFBR_09085 [Pseudomonas sp. NY11955]|uniref:hypothetical protein n=1 Tax=Pseudomonas sp. NY11955 TaxID=3400363 RepID=UPI003A8A3E5F
MTFAERVRDNQVARPNQRSFNLAEWKAAFELDGIDQASKNLYEAGVWFSRAFSTIRGELSFAADKTVSRDDKLLAFVSHANLNAIGYQLSIANIVRESRSQSPAHQSASHILPSVHDSDGVAHSLDQVAQSDIDGLQLPLRMILSQKSSPAKGTQTRAASQSDITVDYAIGTFYKIIEDLWEECLWNNYVLTESAEGVKLSPARPADAHWKWITLSRRSAVHHASNLHHHLMFEQARRSSSHGELAIPRPIVAVTTVDGNYTFVLSADETIGEWSRESYVLMQEALQPYYVELSRFKSPRLAGGTIIDVIKCWTVLQSLVALLKKGSHVSNNQQTPTQALAELTTPRIPRGALIEAISDSLCVTVDISHKLLEFFTYSPSAAQRHEENELWAQPLIALNDSELLVLYTPSLGTTQRNVDIWIRQLGAKFDARGLSFENYLRDVLSSTIGVSPIKRDVALMPHALKFNLPGEVEGEPPYEDIDIVLRIGNAVVIGEAKCFLQPVDPDEVFKHREKVIDAQRQLQRKIGYIQKYKKQFREACARRNFHLPEDFKIQPLILLNGQSHCGIPYAGTPIVDIMILATFLRGVLRQNIVVTKANGVESADAYCLYSDIIEAQALLEAYLMSPPQLQRYVTALGERQVIYSDIVGALEPITYDYFEVDLSRVLGVTPASISSPSQST